MKKVNVNNTDDFLTFSRQKIIEEQLVTGRQTNGLKLTGRITRERFQNQLKQLEELDILKPHQLSVDQVMTTSYLP